MHHTALKHAQLFFETYLPSATGTTIVEIGSQDVNGSLRSVAPPGNRYVGVDFAQGKGVDVVIDDPYALPFPNAYAETCLTSSCFEHSEFFWLSFLEIVRIVKPGGLIYLNVPSNGLVHRFPVDCWRFYPDSGLALMNWARRSGHEVTLLESFIGDQASGYWNDFVAVFLKSGTTTSAHNARMLDHLNGFSNGWRSDQEGPINHTSVPEDQRSLSSRARRWAYGKLGRPL